MKQRSEPRLCIGLPVHNGEEFLPRALESLLAQTFGDFRLIVSDNASTDGTPEICRAFARRDRRVEVHRVEKNRGAAWNFNRVFALADTEYFQWAACDDVWAPDLVRRCVGVLDRRPRAVLCYPRSDIIDERGALVRRYDNPVNATAAEPHRRFQQVLFHLDFCHMLLGVGRRDVLRRTQLMGPYPSSDRILLAELALRGELHEVDDVLFFRRDHPGRPARACRTEQDLAVWFDPANAGRNLALHWIFLGRYLRTIARVPIPAAERARCLALVATWARRNAHPLRAELRHGIKMRLPRTLRSWLAAARHPRSAAPPA